MIATASANAMLSPVANASVAIDALSRRLDGYLDGRPMVRVLDAGCGARRYIDFGNRAHVVGLDLSAADLRRNHALDERIVGDVETFPLESESFDIVICWDVLEHLRHPLRALDNLRRALRMGGLLVLAGPNALSLKGLSTWLTPYWFHRLGYHLLARGEYERPFKTYRRFSATPTGILAWASRSSLRLEHGASYESWLQRGFRERLRLTGRRWSNLRVLALRLTSGRVDLGATDFVMLLRR